MLKLKDYFLVQTILKIFLKNFFSKLSVLETLLLYSNKIENLDSELFANNIKLKKLTLNHNNIKILPKGIFSNLNKLQELDLRSNFISNLEEIFRHNERLRNITKTRRQLNKISLLFYL